MGRGWKPEKDDDQTYHHARLEGKEGENDRDHSEGRSREDGVRKEVERRTSLGTTSNASYVASRASFVLMCVIDDYVNL